MCYSEMCFAVLPTSLSSSPMCQLLPSSAKTKAVASWCVYGRQPSSSCGRAGKRATVAVETFVWNRGL